MRVTELSKAQTLLANLNRTQSSRNNYYNQISTGHRINNASDDPVGTAKVLNYDRILKQTERYQNNITNAKSWLNATESALNNISDSIQRAKVITMEAGNDTMGVDERLVYAVELEDLIDRIFSEINTEHDDTYLFGGTDSTNKPYAKSTDSTGDLYTINSNTDGLNGSILREFEKGEVVKINVSANQVFAEDGDGQDVFNYLTELKTALENSDGEAIRDLTVKFEGAYEQVIRSTTSVGLKYNYAEDLEVANQELITNLTADRSAIYDVDAAEAVVNLETQDLNYQAILQYGSRVLQRSLMDYLG